jgi:hypothetical protein
MNTPTMSTRLLLTLMVLWPSFLMAGLMEMFVFGLVDPSDVDFLGVAHDFPRTGIYTLAFFLFWALVSCACALTLLLAMPTLKARQATRETSNDHGLDQHSTPPALH